MDWRARAECRTADPEQFFPAATAGRAYDAQVRAAKAVCARCRVRPECLAEALRTLPYGIAGGLTEEERRAERSPGRALDPVATLEEELRIGASRARIAAAGRGLLDAGHPVGDVARRCGVSERTVHRWAASTRSATQDVTDVTDEPVAARGVA